jgi:DNA-binding XRE family transcriptional regulator
MRRKPGGAAILKRARKRSRLTQRELAYLARCSQATVYLLEKDGPAGLQTLSDELAIAVCDRLHIDVEDVFEAQSTPSRPRVSNVRPSSSQAESGASVGSASLFTVGGTLVVALEVLLLISMLGIGAR